MDKSQAKPVSEDRKEFDFVAENTAEKDSLIEQLNACVVCCYLWIGKLSRQIFGLRSRKYLILSFLNHRPHQVGVLLRLVELK